jgi:hypothetical protein
MATEKVAFLFCSNGEVRAMEKILPTSSWNLPPTDRQTRAIALLCVKLRIKELLEESSMTKGQAGKLIRRPASERR